MWLLIVAPLVGAVVAADLHYAIDSDLAKAAAGQDSPSDGWPDQRIEARVLAAAAGHLPTPVPHVHASGQHGG